MSITMKSGDDCVNYKIVDYWSENGFNVVVTVEYVKDGDSYFNSFDDMRSRTRDIVFLRSTIYNPSSKEERTLKREAYEHEKVTKRRLFRNDITEPVSTYQAYIEKLAELLVQSSLFIGRQAASKSVTDGLPDSLKGL